MAAGFGRFSKTLMTPSSAEEFPAQDLSGFQWIESPKGHFYADPFMIEDGGRFWAFFEDFDDAKQRGRISCAEVQNGGIVDLVPALERPYHLSYPCVFLGGGYRRLTKPDISLATKSGHFN